jgi:hypothetical protein
MPATRFTPPDVLQPLDPDLSHPPHEAPGPCRQAASQIFTRLPIP